MRLGKSCAIFEQPLPGRAPVVRPADAGNPENTSDLQGRPAGLGDEKSTVIGHRG